MKTTQVASGFVLGAALFFPLHFANALVVYDDGALHIVNDASLQSEFIEVSNGSTLRLETGAVVGDSWEQSGSIYVYDNSRVEIAGAQLGGSGGSSGSILLFEESQLTIENGMLGAGGPSSGQVNAFDRSSVVVLSGKFGGAGSASGMIALLDTSFCEVRGGQFGGSGDSAGLFLAFDASQTQVFACDTGLLPGPIDDLEGSIIGVNSTGEVMDFRYMRDPTATITLVEDCDVVDDTDTDVDGVPDVTDLCPESDLRSTVWIFDINTRIPNLIDDQPVNSDGCSLADLVDDMIQDASGNSDTRYEFLRSVIIGLREFRREGLLPRRLHRHFAICAAHSWRNDSSDRRGKSHRRRNRR